jgi:hypothetical protein
MAPPLHLTALPLASDAALRNGSLDLYCKIVLADDTTVCSKDEKQRPGDEVCSQSLLGSFNRQTQSQIDVPIVRSA